MSNHDGKTKIQLEFNVQLSFAQELRETSIDSGISYQLPILSQIPISREVLVFDSVRIFRLWMLN